MFVKKSKDVSKLDDRVFMIASLANKRISEIGKDKVINATIGSLYDEDNSFVALKSVFNSYRNIKDETLGKYSSSFTGNPTYKKAIEEFVLENRFKNLKNQIVATSGGSGAIFASFNTLLEEHEEVILPDIGWTSYDLMAKEHNLNIVHYKMFDGDKFNLKDVKEKIKASLAKQNKALIVINSPAHNPTGYSLTKEEWHALVDFINNEVEGKEVIILNDVAYIDYCFDLNNNKDYFEVIDKLNENCLFLIAYSISKSLTSYGMRLGALILLNKNEEALTNVFNAFDKTCRSVWSNVNNGAMENYYNLISKSKEEYLNEKQIYIDLLKERSSILIKESKEVNLPLYPFKEGFFISIKIEDDNLLDKFHKALLANDIYAVKVYKGIRVAICSLPVNKCSNLARRLKEILDSL